MNRFKGDCVNIVLNISACKGFDKIRKPRITGKFKAHLINSELKTSNTQSSEAPSTEMVWKIGKDIAKKARGEFAHVRIDIYTVDNKFFGYATISLRTAKIMNNNNSVLSYRWIRLNSVPAAFKRGNPELNIALSIRESRTYAMPKPIAGCNKKSRIPRMLAKAVQQKHAEFVNDCEQHTIDSTEAEQKYAKPILIRGDANVLSINEQLIEDEKAPSLRELSSTSLILKLAQREKTTAFKYGDLIAPYDGRYTKLMVEVAMISLCWVEGIPAENILIIFNHPIIKTQKRYKTATDLGCNYTYIPFENVGCKMLFLTLQGDEVHILNKYPPSVEIINADTKEPLSHRLFLDEYAIQGAETNYFLFRRYDNDKPLCNCGITVTVHEVPTSIQPQASESDLRPIVISESCLMHKMQEFQEWLNLRKTECREQLKCIVSLAAADTDEESEYVDCHQDIEEFAQQDEYILQDIEDLPLDNQEFPEDHQGVQVNLDNHNYQYVFQDSQNVSLDKHDIPPDNSTTF